MGRGAWLWVMVSVCVVPDIPTRCLPHCLLCAISTYTKCLPLMSVLLSILLLSWVLPTLRLLLFITAYNSGMLFVCWFLKEPFAHLHATWLAICHQLLRILGPWFGPGYKSHSMNSNRVYWQSTTLTPDSRSHSAFQPCRRISRRTTIQKGHPKALEKFLDKP